VGRVKLQPFRGQAQLAAYVIALRPKRADEATATEPGPDPEWWSWNARAWTPTEGFPWWARYLDDDLSWLPMTATDAIATHPAPSTVTSTTDNAPPNAPTQVPTAPAATPASDEQPWWSPTQP
jgi:hypothetical protein